MGFETRIALAGRNEYFRTGLAGFFDDPAACTRSSQAQAQAQAVERSTQRSAHDGPVSGAWVKPDAQDSLAADGSSSRVYLEMARGQTGIQLRERARLGPSRGADPTQTEVRRARLEQI